MKRPVLLLAFGLVLIASRNVFAGPEPIDTKDSKVVQQAVVEQPCRWTGFYMGLHGGYGWSDLSFTELNVSGNEDPPLRFEPAGFFGGGQAGANLQLGSWFVIGVEGAISSGDFDDSADIFPPFEHNRGHVHSDWVATAAGRVGVSFWRNRLLAYAKGGAAFTQFRYHTEEVGGGEFFNAEEDQTVALLGFGLEYALTCHWSAKIEYNHFFFDSHNVTAIQTDNGFLEERTFRADIGDRDAVLLGVNFKF